MLRASVQRRLVERFDKRVLVLRAPAGFGKTTSLSQAFVQNQLVRRGVDLWMTCESGDKDMSYLLDGLARSIGLEPTTVADVVAKVASYSPAHVCLIFDDVHEIPHESEGAGVILRLIEDLPANGSVLLATRHDPPVPLARLDAQGQVGWVDSADLTFDDAEVSRLADAAGVDPDELRRFGGWPALLALGSRTRDVSDFIHEEVLSWLTTDQRIALEATVALGAVDHRLLHHLAGVNSAVLADLPLMHQTDGWFVPHELWVEAVTALVPAERLLEAQATGIEFLLAEGETSRAIDACLRAGVPDRLELAVRGAISKRLASPIPEVSRWLAELRRADHGGPSIDHLAGLLAQYDDPTSTQTRLLFAKAAEGFRDLGDHDAEIASLVEVGYWHHIQRDVEGLFGVAARMVELTAQGVDGAVPYAAISEAFVALISGDPSAALTAVRRVRPEDVTPGFRAMADWVHAQALELSGFRSIDQADACGAHGASTAAFAMLGYSSRWRNGDIEELVDDWTWRSEPVDPRDVFLRSVWLGITDAAFGDLHGAQGHLDAARGMTGGAEQIEISLGLLEIAIAGEVGDADRRRSLLTDLLRRCPPRDANRISYNGAGGMITRELPEWTPYFESPNCGPLKRRDLELGAALRALDQGSLDGITSAPWPHNHGGLITALLLRGAAEFVSGAWAVGRPEAREAASWMARVIGPPARLMFREISDHDNPQVAAAAREIVARIPVPPRHRIVISVLGPASIVIDGRAISDPNWRRERVRSLLGYLTLRHRTTREAAIAALWPEADDSAGKRNLRSTLNLLHSVLEPGRTAGEAPFFIRSDGPALELCVGEHLMIDSWSFEQLLNEAERLESAGVPEVALESLLSALDLYRGEFLADAAYDDWSAGERDRIRSRFVRGSVRAAELLLAFDRADEALLVAGRTLDAEPWSEAAHRVVIASHLERGDHPAARRAMERCREALDDIGGPVEELTLMLDRRLGNT